ncbi:MAG TPA: endonuclease III [Candidatus Limnocylindria bacterium]|nr:endonuclease III [Candidatus Limnocylindria bacterium]
MTPARKKTFTADDARSRLTRILDRLETVHPDAKLDLDFTNPLELLIALILAAQARDDLVNKVTVDLFKRYRAAADYATAPQSKLESQIGKINFYRNKAKSIRNCCKELVERFDGKVPANLEDLISLPGVGRKTANIVLGNAFGKQAIGVDTHVMRLAQRLGLTKNTDPDKVETDLMAVVPESRRVRFCHVMQYHGRRICLAKKPKCPQCVIRSVCPFPHKTPDGHVGNSQMSRKAGRNENKRSREGR